MFRDDVVKDDLGSFAVFTEQVSPASELTAAKVLGVISRLHGCAGHVTDAVSADSKSRLRTLQNYSTISCVGMPGTKFKTLLFILTENG